MKKIAINPSRCFVIPLILCLFFAVLLSACQEDETGAPQIFALRLTDPAVADSTFTASELGQTIVILGKNLATTQQVFFNDVEAYVNPALIRDDNIILSVPTVVPGELNNLVTVITANGLASHPFEVEIPAPVISHVSLEMVSPGDIIVIEGDYFFSSEVTIGGVPAEVISETQERLEVMVTEGTTGGALVVTTLFGESTHNYPINEMGTVLLDWEDGGKIDCWFKLKIYRPGDVDKPVPVITGNYGHISTEDMGQTYWFDPGVITTCGSAGVSGDVSTMALKMEVNIPEPIQTGYYRLQFKNTWEYRVSLWEDAPFQSDGWITVTIPLSEFKSGGASLNSASEIADLWFVFINESDQVKNEVFNWNIDNVRIVEMIE